MRRKKIEKKFREIKKLMTWGKTKSPYGILKQSLGEHIRRIDTYVERKHNSSHVSN